MSRTVVPSSNVAPWSFMLVATLWSASTTLPAGALTTLLALSALHAVVPASVELCAQAVIAITGSETTP